MQNRFTVITNIGDGRSLISSPKGDQYFLEEADGSRKQLTVQEAVQILQEVKARQAAAKPKRKRTPPKPLPMTKDDIEAAARYILNTDLKERARFAPMDLTFEQKVKAKAKEIRAFLRKITKGRDPRDRTPEIWIGQYIEAARKQKESQEK
jgi:hypothetical protein